MSTASFDILVGILGNTLAINPTKFYARSEAGPIIPEIRLHCLMRYLAGGSYLDIRILVSIPHSTFYYILWTTCDAINDCPQLDFSLPCTEAELNEASAGFEGISPSRHNEGMHWGHRWMALSNSVSSNISSWKCEDIFLWSLPTPWV
jgi:hypothetical protein